MEQICSCIFCFSLCSRSLYCVWNAPWFITSNFQRASLNYKVRILFSGHSKNCDSEKIWYAKTSLFSLKFIREKIFSRILTFHTISWACWRLSPGQYISSFFEGVKKIKIFFTMKRVGVLNSYIFYVKRSENFLQDLFFRLKEIMLFFSCYNGKRKK